MTALTPAERIERHTRMAEAYRDAYLRHEVHAGAGYAAWTFADGAVYASPYFTGNEVLLLKDVIRSTAVVATMEAAIGARGPFRGEEYVDALTKHLGAHGRA